VVLVGDSGPITAHPNADASVSVAAPNLVKKQEVEKGRRKEMR
jgi:hypothetical protein